MKQEAFSIKMSFGGSNWYRTAVCMKERIVPEVELYSGNDKYNTVKFATKKENSILQKRKGGPRRSTLSSWI